LAPGAGYLTPRRARAGFLDLEWDIYIRQKVDIYGTRQQQYLTHSNDAANLTDWTEARGIVRTDQGLRIDDEGVLQSVSIGYAYETRENANLLRPARQSRSHALNVGALTQPLDHLRLLPSIQLVRPGNGLEPRRSDRVYMMHAQHQRAAGRLRLSLDLRRTERPDAAWWEAAVTSALALGG
jgi:hypothetical protein